MLAALGTGSVKELLDQTLPPNLRRTSAMDLPAPVDETEAQQQLFGYASQCHNHSLIGDGFYATRLPPVITRNILENPAWYTAYTPYQSEISQGRLTILLHFQQLICDLTGFSIANASLLDEASAAGEAMMFALRIKPKSAHRFYIHESVPQRIVAVLQTRAALVGIELVSEPAEDLCGGLVSFPRASYSDPQVEQLLQNQNALAIAHADPLALSLMPSPASRGFDAAIGSVQRFGLPMGGGGPHAAFFATHLDHARMVPGRIIARSRDTSGTPALRMALQSREQHIRRARATSNICTAQVLPAVLATAWALWHHSKGIRRIAEHVAACAQLVSDAFIDQGWQVDNCDLHWEVSATGEDAEAVRAKAAGFGIDLGGDTTSLVVAPGETTSLEQIARVVAALGGDAALAAIEANYAQARQKLAELPLVSLDTALPYLRSETQAMRYFRKLSDMDLALDRTSIPLGSCTMKLNAASQMQPITTRQVADIHPARIDGSIYPQMASDLEAWLGEICDLDAVALQPNAGSQGEFTGLYAIRSYHQTRGQGHRTLCLVPESAHGTNPSSAVLAGLKVLPVATGDNGTIDVDRLHQTLAQHSGNVAALMLTYPSTAGVFEEGVVEITSAVHAAGGQVYLDGANMNAMMGLLSLRDLGVDVAHLNLHKTFCIPHGGGGPGVGAVVAAAHLAQFLPGYRAESKSVAVASVANAPLGNAGVLPISWVYIRSCGAEGLQKCSENAIVAANYIATSLAPHYRMKFEGAQGCVAHECTLDLRQFKAAGIDEMDVAKRLIDYGFHAPTVSFPLPGTLMIEPTESEPLSEIDRFISAMIAIRSEIAKVESGEWPADDNPLKNAPHTACALTGEWEHCYSRQAAVYPAAELAHPGNKYWPPVGRIDAVWGDRNLLPTWAD